MIESLVIVFFSVKIEHFLLVYRFPLFSGCCLCVFPSERASASGATGDRLKEGSNINRSLVTLGIVISTLGKHNRHFITSVYLHLKNLFSFFF